MYTFALGGFADDQAYDLSLATSTASGTRAFYHADVPLPAGATHTVRPDWDTLGQGGVTVEVDLDGDGDTDETITLGNEGLPVGSEEAGAETVEAFAVTVAPNPAGHRATVEVTLPEAADLRVEVFDLLGRRVGVLHEGSRPAGRYVLEFEASRLRPGVYIVRAEADGQVRTRRITAVR